MSRPHLLAAIDGSAVSRNAAAVATRLAAVVGGSCSTLLVRPHVPDAAIQPPPGVAVVHGVPSVEICRRAEQLGASMIVLGRAEPEETGFRPMRTGEGVVRRSTVPTLHVPAAAGRFARAVIALDGGERGLVALRLGTDVAGRLGLPAEIVTVEPAELAPVFVHSPDDDDRSQRLALRLSQLRLDLPLRLLHGDPVQQILGVIGPDDLLVVGYRRGVEIAHPRGVGRRLIWLAPCAVLAIPI